MSKRQMLINYVPGEECRLAVVQDGKLEELHAERLNAVSHVGNIYVGKVVNVESAIQAAFIDFGLEHNGFLHISDLHPRYFPGEDDATTERVGKKTPRRERPPIQAALKRGQEIIVQVLKEGIGTKGPTLTSYLSIPGRFLVMMPDMDKVGVSRKVEDEDQRQKMRQILDQLDLPDGFGFILRTAGMGQTKTEVKRDLAYLNRLWKDMERRRKAGNKPRLLYAESDLLTRSLRDILTSDIHEVIIDDVSALRRAARFMKIISPRRSTKLLHYDGGAPLFHAYGVEEQIRRIFAREVPLPSGGSLVIDETEAMIAIDVNSGKMRNHGDAETTAYKTNAEAVDEICRQLKLRDLGGLVLMDLIDMRSRSHRKQIETCLRNNLKNDRARTRALPISQFGIVELTRQRMRGSVRSAHFTACPDCVGRGVVQRPDSVANDSMRDLASLLENERVQRVELVVSPRVASELLSNKRRRLSLLERRTGKHVDVRVSETIAIDRVTFYAYDDRGADIDVEKLPPHKTPSKLEEWTQEAASRDDWAVDPLTEKERLEEQLDEQQAAEARQEPVPDADIDEDETEAPKKKRRGRRGGRKRRGKGRDTESKQDKKSPDRKKDKQNEEKKPEPTSQDEESDKSKDDSGEEDGAPRKKRRRRGRRGGRKRSGRDKSESQSDSGSGTKPGAPADSKAAADTRDDAKTKPKAKSRAEAGDSDEKPIKLADESRADSWDLEPSDVRPQAKPKKASTQSRKPASKPEKPAATGNDRAGSDDDSWDIEPGEAPPRRTPEPEPARAEAPDGAGGRGDSWDMEPAGADAAPPKIEDGKKPARAKKTTKKASTRKKKPAAAKKTSKRPATRKKAAKKKRSKAS